MYMYVNSAAENAENIVKNGGFSWTNHEITPLEKVFILLRIGQHICRYTASVIG